MAVSKRLRYEIFRRDNNTCQYCGAKAPDVEIVPDHVVPVALGGKDEPSNLVTACGPCNSGKSATPPDAAMVAKVADDAVRWADAIKVAAEEMLGDRKTRDAARESFDQKWTRWNEGRPPVPRPEGWGVSVDSFLKAGLPLPVLLDCVDIAMSARHVKADGVFKYMCGAAWKEVTKLQEAARRTVAPKAGSMSSDGECGPSIEATVDYLLARFDERQIAGAFRDADDINGDEETDQVERKIHALSCAISELMMDIAGLSYGLERLLRVLPNREGHHALDSASAQMQRRFGADFNNNTALTNAAVIVADSYELRAASAYLDTLPMAERSEWIDCIRTYYSDMDFDFTEEDHFVEAAGYARRAKEAPGHVLPGLCSSHGEHGAMCPKPVTHEMWLEECGGCTGECEGHAVCQSHIEALVDGSHTTNSGRTLTVRDFAALEGS